MLSNIQNYFFLRREAFSLDEYPTIVGYMNRGATFGQTVIRVCRNYFHTFHKGPWALGVNLRLKERIVKLQDSMSFVTIPS